MTTLRFSVLSLLAFLLPAARSLRFSESQGQSQPGEDEDDVEVREHSVVKILGRAPKADAEALREVQSQISAYQCRAMTRLLAAQADTTLSSRLLQIACEDEYKCEIQLPDMSEGCLFASKDRHLKAMLSTIGRPNPCAFSTLFFNSFFRTGSCPDHEKNLTATSNAGVTYGTCVRGLTTVEDSCATITKLGDSEPGHADVYAVDAVVGLPVSWESAMTEYRIWNEARKARKEAKPKRTPAVAKLEKNQSATLKIKMFSCPVAPDLTTARGSWKDPLAKKRSEILALVKKQVDVLNTAYTSGLPCKHQVGDPPLGDSGLRFDAVLDADLVQIEDDDMCMRCDTEYQSLWDKYMKEERGVLKVLLCTCNGLLGVSAFPWSNHRGTMFDYRTLPGGGMYKYDEGKTMVHELGHYFGLYHTFQDGCYYKGDRVDDTNKEANPFFGCPDENLPPTTCNDPGYDPVNNFMDYADDRCMCSFTEGQRQRLHKDAAKYILPL